MGNRRSARIAYLSRDRRFLLQAALVIVTTAFVIAFVIHRLADPGDGAFPHLHSHAPVVAEDGSSSGSDDLAGGLEAALAADPIDRERLAEWIREFARMWRLVRDRAEEVAGVTGGERAATRTDMVERIGRRIADSRLERAEATLFDAFLRAVTQAQGARAAAIDFLSERAAEEPPPRFANEFLAYARAVEGDRGAALDAYLREWEAHGSDFSRQAAASLVVESPDAGEARRIAAIPGFVDGLSDEIRLEIAARSHDYLEVARLHARLWTRGYGWPEIVLTVLCAVVWFLIVAQTTGVTGRRAVIWGVPSLGLGILSILLTLVFISVQETHTGVRATGDILQDAVFYLAGVGLREEAAKLILFAALLPILVRRGTGEALAVACASWVGLGFAVEENVRYFQGNASVWARFLTANFLHLSTTGIAGLALYRMARQPGRHWEGALAAFLGVVVIHGLYDLSIANPQLAPETGALSIVFLAALAFWYFQVVSEVRESGSPAGGRHRISPLGVFVVGSALLVGGALIYSAAFTPAFNEAVANVGTASLGMVPVAFLFINRFRSE